MQQRTKLAEAILAAAPPLPLKRPLWRAVMTRLRLSKRQAEVTELVARDLSNKQIVIVTGLGEGTVKDYLKRIAERTETRGRVQLVCRIMTVSHEVNGNGQGE